MYERAAQQFPDYPLAELPSIPSDWADVSWGGETCPSFEVCGLQVFIDYPNPADREIEGPRFFILRMDDGELLAESDDWDTILATVADWIADGIEQEADRSRA